MADDHTSQLPAGLTALIARAGSSGRGKPPVDQWHPEFCGDLDIRIDRNGQWFYMGTPIGREPLVRLFASVLRKDADGRHYLVTPVEKIGIQVEDAPFLGVELHLQGVGERQLVTVRTNVGDVVEIDADHPLWFVEAPENGGLMPYIRVRGSLDARLNRPLLYELCDHLDERGNGDTSELGIWSGGSFFPLPQPENV